MIFSSEDNAAKLYGEIYGGQGQWIVSELSRFLKGKKSATIHLHTPGGSVFDGNLIYNELRRFKGELIIVIDGISASMGTIIMLAANKIKMADNAWVMIHNPEGGTRGNAKAHEQTAKVLRELERQFIDAYSKRTGKSAEDLASWLDGDNWFSANMALEEKIIDEVIDPVLDDESINSLNQHNIAASLDSFESDEDLRKRLTNKVNKQKSDKTMALKAKTIVALGLDPEATEDKVNAAVESLIARNEALEKVNEDMVTAQKAETTKAIDVLIASAKKEGRIQAKDEDRFRRLAEKDLDLAKDTIAALPVKENITGAVTGDRKNQGAQPERKDWSYKDWKQKDMAGLLAMADENPEAYAELLKTSNLK